MTNGEALNDELLNKRQEQSKVNNLGLLKLMAICKMKNKNIENTEWAEKVQLS